MPDPERRDAEPYSDEQIESIRALPVWQTVRDHHRFLSTVDALRLERDEARRELERARWALGELRIMFTMAAPSTVFNMAACVGLIDRAITPARATGEASSSGAPASAAADSASSSKPLCGKASTPSEQVATAPGETVPHRTGGASDSDLAASGGVEGHAKAWCHPAGPREPVSSPARSQPSTPSRGGGECKACDGSGWRLTASYAGPCMTCDGTGRKEA